MQSLCTEEAYILLGKLECLDGHAFVAVIEVEAHTALEARADDREVITAIACADACQLEERVETEFDETASRLLERPERRAVGGHLSSACRPR